MSYLYCQSCGIKNSYVGVKPNFCSSCGIKMGSVAEATEKEVSNNKVIERGSGLVRRDKINGNEDEGNEDETDIDYVPHIGNIEVDIDFENIGMSKTYAAHEIIGTNAQVPQEQEEEPKTDPPVRRQVKSNRSGNSKKA